jgi:MFS-type transporter involved in bile tolerance (Atg22 family)
MDYRRQFFAIVMFIALIGALFLGMGIYENLNGSEGTSLVNIGILIIIIAIIFAVIIGFITAVFGRKRATLAENTRNPRRLLTA